MRMNGIYVENYLSFGLPHKPEGPDGSFALDRLNDDVTILVGPNGAGKTNVLRVAWLIRRALAPTEQSGGQELRHAFHRPCGDRKPMVLAMDVEFDTDAERRALGLMWLLALATTTQDVLQGVGGPADPRALRQWTEQMVSAPLDPSHVRWLHKGRIRVTIGPPHPSGIVPKKDVRFCLDERSGRSLELVIGSTNGVLEFPRQAGPSSSIHPMKHVIESLPDPMRTDLIQFFQRKGSFPPDFDFQRLLERPVPRDDQQNRYQVTTEIGEIPDMPPPLVEWQNELRQLLGPPPSRENLAWVVGRLVEQAIVCVGHWEPQAKALLRRWGTSADLLAEGNLPLYLFALKNGSGAERERFAHVQDEFQKLTRRCLGVTLRSPVPSRTPDRSSIPNVPELRIPLAKTMYLGGNDSNDWMTPAYNSYDDVKYKLMPVRPEEGMVCELTCRSPGVGEIPLDSAGAGLLQVAYWCALTQGEASQALLLDEPDLHFHPALAARVAHTLAGLDHKKGSVGGTDAGPAGNGEGDRDRARKTPQIIVISHTPWSIPEGNLRQVRRIRLEGGRSAVSPKVDEDAEKNLVLSKRGKDAEERMFLFANVTVFVEGSSDAYAFQTWFDRWVHNVKDQEDASGHLGVRFQPCGGKNSIGPLLGAALFYEVPSLGVWDADVLRPTDNVPGSWQTHELVDQNVIDKMDASQDLSEKDFPSGRVYILGTVDSEKNLEKLWLDGQQDENSEYMADEKQCRKTVYKVINDMKKADDPLYTPLAYREMARRNPKDEDLKAFLDRVGLRKVFCEIWRLAMKA